MAAEHPAASLSLLDRFRRWRYYRREYRLARLRGQSLYMPPPWRKQSSRWWHDPHSGQFVTVFCCLCIAFPAAVGLITAWLSGQL